MKIYISIEDRNLLPETDELACAMWSEGISFSKCGNDSRFRNCSIIELSWDKWIDDRRWSGNKKSKESVYFKLPYDRENPQTLVTVELEDNAVLVDKRAFYNAVLCIAKKAVGKISLDGSKWINSKEFEKLARKYIQYNFKNAAEMSLKEDNKDLPVF